MTTAQQLGSIIKSARQIMRKDKGLSGDLDRLPTLDVLVQRTERKPRPLLQGKNRRKVLADLLKKRQALYEAAHLRISRGEETIRPAIESVLEALPQDWKPEGT